MGKMGKYELLPGKLDRRAYRLPGASEEGSPNVLRNALPTKPNGDPKTAKKFISSVSETYLEATLLEDDDDDDDDDDETGIVGKLASKVGARGLALGIGAGLAGRHMLARAAAKKKEKEEQEKEGKRKKRRESALEKERHIKRLERVRTGLEY